MHPITQFMSEHMHGLLKKRIEQRLRKNRAFLSRQEVVYDCHHRVRSSLKALADVLARLSGCVESALKSRQVRSSRIELAATLLTASELTSEMARIYEIGSCRTIGDNLCDLRIIVSLRLRAEAIDLVLQRVDWERLQVFASEQLVGETYCAVANAGTSLTYFAEVGRQLGNKFVCGKDVLATVRQIERERAREIEDSST